MTNKELEPEADPLERMWDQLTPQKSYAFPFVGHRLLSNCSAVVEKFSI